MLSVWSQQFEKMQLLRFKMILVLLFFFAELIPGSSGPSGVIPLSGDSEGPSLRELHQAWAQLRSSETFEKIHSDVRCDDPPISKGPCQGMSDCKKRCSGDQSCKYFAYWTKTKWCETYEYCNTQSADGKKSIILYMRIDPCDKVIQDYLAHIPTFFAENAVRTQPPNPNFHCVCVNPVWMLCVIFVEIGSRDEEIVRARFDRTNLEVMKPFYINPSSVLSIGKSSPIVYNEKPLTAGFPEVFTEMEVLNLDRCLHVNICIKGTPGNVCPITKDTFRSGDAVFILSTDQERATRGVPVPCISLSGLQRWNVMHDKKTEGKGFPEIFRRTDRLMRREDYTFNIIFDDADFANGLCRRRKGGILAQALVEDIPSDEVSPVQRTPSAGDAASSSSAAGSSSSAVPIPQQEETNPIPIPLQGTPSGKSKGKKKKKKGKGSAGSPANSGSPAFSGSATSPSSGSPNLSGLVLEQVEDEEEKVNRINSGVKVSTKSEIQISAQHEERPDRNWCPVLIFMIFIIFRAFYWFPHVLPSLNFHKGEHLQVEFYHPLTQP